MKPLLGDPMKSKRGLLWKFCMAIGNLVLLVPLTLVWWSILAFYLAPSLPDYLRRGFAVRDALRVSGRLTRLTGFAPFRGVVR